MAVVAGVLPQPQALGHLYLQVLIFVRVAGAIPGVIGAEAGAAHLAEERCALLPPQPAEGEMPGLAAG